MSTSASRADPTSGAAGRRLLFLREQFAWMGPHSGYDRLFDELDGRWPGGSDSVWRRRSPWWSVLLQPLTWLVPPRTAFYDGDSLRAELAALHRARSARSALVHVAFVENNLRLLATRRRGRDARLVGTAHQGEAWWRSRHGHPELISRLDALIVLCRRQQAYFEDFLPGGVHFIRHGVDTAFFRPAEAAADAEPERSPRCVFAGIWQRDLVMLGQAIDLALAQRPALRFDMVVPRRGRAHPELQRIARHDRVTWHTGVSSETLRDVYRGARMLVLPLLDATANNTLLESMACGLPVVTTAVGGVEDYTDVSFATRLAPGDVDGLVAAMLRLADDPAEARARGAHARAFAERHLSWASAAGETLALYRALLSPTDAGGPAERAR